ncbi:hypothetical protein HJC99_01390 [Candidatus Saccharibacteria bacterium]|nr:hypothetical protein [Candidatus Saccharibacteria bacterium]
MIADLLEELKQQGPHPSREKLAEILTPAILDWVKTRDNDAPQTELLQWLDNHLAFVPVQAIVMRANQRRAARAHQIH